MPSGTKTRHQNAHLVKGKQAEDLACHYLREQGLTLLQRNYRWQRGEIDLIMREHRTLVFVEVRARRSTRFGTAAETVTRSKQARLIATAARFLQRHGFADLPARFDVVTIALDGQPPRIEWLKDAFRAI